MKPEAVSYSHIVTDLNGDKHEVGVHGSIDEGESYEQALNQAREMVYVQTSQFTVNFDAELQEAETEVGQLDAEIQERLDSLGSFTQFAELHGLDFKPPEYNIGQVNDEQGREAGETPAA
jgi:hypothetical protein